MAHNLKRFDKKGLYNEVQSARFRAVFEDIKRDVPILKQFDSIEVLICFAEDKETDKNHLVYNLIRLYQGQRVEKSNGKYYRSALLSLLLILLWRQLEQTHYAYKGRLWFLDRNDTFSEIYGAYLIKIAEWRSSARSKIVSKLQDKAESFIRQSTREEQRHQRLRNHPPLPKHQYDYTRVERIASEWVGQSVITEVEKQIVLGKAVYGQTFKELGRELKTLQDTVSKKYYRAIKRLREFLKNKVEYGYRGRPYFPWYF